MSCWETHISKDFVLAAALLWLSAPASTDEHAGSQPPCKASGYSCSPVQLSSRFAKTQKNCLVTTKMSVPKRLKVTGRLQRAQSPPLWRNQHYNSLYRSIDKTQRADPIGAHSACGWSFLFGFPLYLLSLIPKTEPRCRLSRPSEQNWYHIICVTETRLGVQGSVTTRCWML